MCFSSFSIDSANLTVRAGPVLRGMLGEIRNVSFYVAYPDYDDDIMDYDIALVKVRSAKLEVNLLSFSQCSTFISLSDSAHFRQQNQGIRSQCIITNKDENKQEATIAAPPCLHRHLQSSYVIPSTFVSPSKCAYIVVSPTWWQANGIVHVSFHELSLR
jgi:hypothetical protein